MRKDKNQEIGMETQEKKGIGKKKVVALAVVAVVAAAAGCFLAGRGSPAGAKKGVWLLGRMPWGRPAGYGHVRRSYQT